MMSMIYEILGWMGTVTFLLAYYGISSGKLKADGIIYQWMNLGGAIAVSFSVFVKKAWPAFALEIVWGSIALVTLIRIINCGKKKE